MSFLLMLSLLVAPAPIDIIYDTDMHSDCDDAGALAVLHAFADEGLVTILGVVHTSPAPYGPQCVTAINGYYDRGDIPVGGMTWKDYATAPHYEKYRKGAAYIENSGRDYLPVIAREFPLKSERIILDSVLLYRKLLSGVDDNSVVICAVGQLTGLAGLLESEGDGFSPLSGLELVKQKVRLLVTMARGDWPEGRDTFNWICDIPSAAKVINNWPVAMAVMPHGETILTGGKLVAESPKENPVRRIYEIYVKKEDHLRSSWDQCAVYYAVKGPDALFKPRTGRILQMDPKTGKHNWVPDDTSEQVYIEQQADDETVAAVIEELMCRTPKR